MTIAPKPNYIVIAAKVALLVYEKLKEKKQDTN